MQNKFNYMPFLYLSGASLFSSPFLTPPILLSGSLSHMKYSKVV